MQSGTQGVPVSKKRLWAGRIISGLIVAFLVLDGVIKFIKPAPVVEAFAHLGLPLSLAVCIGIILLACTVLYLIPRTSILGAILLTGYLGGATAAQVRVSHPAFETVFPIMFGVLIWAGTALREDRLRALIPLRR
jgi:hypothetical protein